MLTTSQCDQEQLEHNATARGIDIERWVFVTGNSATVNRVLNSFNIITLAQGNDDISHSPQVLLIESSDNDIQTYDGNNASLANEISRDIRLLTVATSQ